MSAPLASAEAIARLREDPNAYRTPESLRALAAQVEADAPGKLTVLYSGPVASDIGSGTIINAMRAAGENVRVIDNSQAAKFLQSDDFYHAVAETYGIQAPPLMDGTYRGPATDWLYHPTEGPWADASARFVDATKGEVRAIVSDAKPDRVFGATELPHALANPDISTLEGFPRATLVQAQASHGAQAPFDMIVARAYDHVGTLNVAVNYAGTPLRGDDGQLLLDSRAYLAGTAIEGKTPVFNDVTRPLADRMPAPGMHVQAGVTVMDAQAHAARQAMLQAENDRLLLRGAGALGAAAVAYDAATTGAHTADLLHQGNTLGAESEIVHFGGRNLGALGGAALGAELFGTAGAETGPADLLIGGAGAVVGAVAGKQLADAYDNHRIYHQTDPQGTTWQYDPKLPQQGWTRTVNDGFAERGLSSTHVETAPPALAERLTFQANNTAVELALAHPATPRDPYTQPAGPHDARSLTDAPWTRDAQTRQWSRTVTDAVMEHGLKSTHIDIATPQRAAQLDAAAEHTIAENLANSPRGLAEHYQAMYEQRGWQRLGPMPHAVVSALQAPDNTLLASDGHTYTHDAQGQWTTPGMLFGTNSAKGNVRAELDATYAQAHDQQAAVSPPSPSISSVAPRHEAQSAEASPQPSALAAPSRLFLELSAKIDRFTKAMDAGDREAMMKEVAHVEETPAWKEAWARAQAAVAEETRQQTQYLAQHPRDPRDATHPDHALHESIREQVISLHTQAGIFPTREMIGHLTASVARDARASGLDRVDQLHFNADRSAVVATQENNGYAMMGKIAATDIRQAMQTAPEQAYRQMAQETQRQAEVQQAIQQQIAQSRQTPSLGR